MFEAIGAGAACVGLFIMVIEKAVKLSAKLEILNQKIGALDERLDRIENNQK